jgi:hypothetical protein
MTGIIFQLKLILYVVLYVYLYDYIEMYNITNIIPNSNLFFFHEKSLFFFPFLALIVQSQ